MVETETGGQTESGQRGDRVPRTQAVNLRCWAEPGSVFSQLLPHPGKDLRNHPIRGNPPLWCPKYHSWRVVCICGPQRHEVVSTLKLFNLQDQMMHNISDFQTLNIYIGCKLPEFCSIVTPATFRLLKKSTMKNIDGIYFWSCANKLD